MKKILLSAVLLSFTALAVAQEKNSSLIHVNGEHIIKVEPDGATVNFAITTKNKELTQAKQENDKVVSKAIAYLKSQNIPERNIRTTRLDLQPYNEYVKDKEPIQYFRAQQAITFTLTDLNQLAEVLSGLVDQGVNTIQNVQFTSSKLGELQDQARSEAVKDAKAKAEILANALGQSLGKAHVVNDNTSGSSPGPILYRAFAKAADASSEQAPIATGEMEIRANVSISFFLND